MNRRLWLLPLLVSAGCSDLSRSSSALSGEQAPGSPPMEEKPSRRMKGFAADSDDEGRMEAKKEMAAPKPAPAPSVARAGGGKADANTIGLLATGAAAPEEPADKAGPGGGEGSAGSDAAPTRAWFPETFLFEPMIETDDAGRAALEVRVPDRLTSWRVLALAHARDGGQAGATTSFLGTLPVYVDPVVPPFLVAGDEVRLPVQVVNTTGESLTAELKLEALGASLSRTGGSVTVAGGQSRVEYVTLQVPRPGPAAVRAAIGRADAVVRAIPVEPSGRPVSERAGGTLGAPRSIPLTADAKADRASAHVRLGVWPGALAIVRSELAGVLGRGGAAADAHALLLAGRAPGLLEALGEKHDPEAVRRLSLLATQRIVRHARGRDPLQGTLFVEAALAHRENPVLDRLGEQLAARIAAGQRPDGTCGGGGWTLQRVLVATADCARAVGASDVTPAARQRAAGVKLKAGAAFERHAELVTDPYTAAAALSSGAVHGALQEKLRERVRKAVVDAGSGAKKLPVEDQVTRTDGSRPSELEATALAVLALDPVKDAGLRADLGSFLLGGYSAGRGFGDGQANLHALRAVVELFREPPPREVKIELLFDDQPIAEGVLDSVKLKQIVTLDALVPNAPGTHTYGVRATPPLPGLGFSLELETWVPWETEKADEGLELTSTLEGALQVGKAAELHLVAAAPAGLPLELVSALPAGVQPDTASLDRLVAEGRIASFDTEDGAVRITIAPLQPGQLFDARYRVVPTLAGAVRPRASSLSSPARPAAMHHVPPTVWKIAP